jgi:hypothetical protein
VPVRTFGSTSQRVTAMIITVAKIMNSAVGQASTGRYQR